MTVIETLTGGGTEECTRSGDRFVKQHNGCLDVVRGGDLRPFGYGVGDWGQVEGDERSTGSSTDRPGNENQVL